MIHMLKIASDEVPPGLTFTVPKTIWKNRNWTALPEPSEASDGHDDEASDGDVTSSSELGLEIAGGHDSGDGVRTRSQAKAKAGRGPSVATTAKGKHRG